MRATGTRPNTLPARTNERHSLAMTTPTETPTANPAEAPAAPVDRFAQIRTKIAEYNADIAKNDKALKQLARLEGGTGSDAYKMIEGIRDANVQKRDALNRQIENAERTEKLAAFTQPIIDAFGVLSVANAKVLPTNIDALNLDVQEKKAAELEDKAKSIRSLCSHLKTAIQTAGVPEDALGDLKTFHVVVEGEHNVKISVATRAARGTGTRGGANSTLVKITGATDPNNSMIGKTVGNGGDFATWKSLLESFDPALFADKEAKKRDNNSNYSATRELVLKYGFTYVDAAPASDA